MVEISSIGREMVLLSIVPSLRLVLIIRDGEGGAMSVRLLRLVKALTSAMVYLLRKWPLDGDV